MNYYLDTNICVYFMKGRFSLIHDRISGLAPHSVKIPAMVFSELHFGALKSQQIERNLIRLEAFLAPYEVIPFDQDAARHHAQIRLECQKHLPGPSDLMIGAIVRSRGGILVTHNLREFQRIPQLRCESWVEETP